MMLRLGDDPVFTDCLAVSGDPLTTVMHFYFSQPLVHPHGTASILPWHRVPAALPRHEGIACHSAQFVIHLGIRRPPIE